MKTNPISDWKIKMIIHISENEYIKKNEIEINAKRIKSITCRICQKKFSHRSDKSKHETGEKCKL